MTQQFIKSEVKNYIKFLFPELNDEQINEKFEQTEFNLNEEQDKILIEIKDGKTFKGFTMGWSYEKGIYGLVDEDRDFDLKFQES
jgi:hypothetical protein